MKISVALIAALVALSPGAFAQDKAPPIDDKAAQEQEKQAREAERRAAAEKRALDYQRYKDELMKKCVIKPVMTDDEIELCKKAYKA
jgi:hypothetical protein